MALPAPQSYSPESFRPLTFHDAVPVSYTHLDVYKRQPLLAA